MLAGKGMQSPHETEEAGLFWMGRYKTVLSVPGHPRHDRSQGFQFQLGSIGLPRSIFVALSCCIVILYIRQKVRFYYRFRLRLRNSLISLPFPQNSNARIRDGNDSMPHAVVLHIPMDIVIDIAIDIAIDIVMERASFLIKYSLDDDPQDNTNTIQYNRI